LSRITDSTVDTFAYTCGFRFQFSHAKIRTVWP